MSDDQIEKSYIWNVYAECMVDKANMKAGPAREAGIVKTWVKGGKSKEVTLETIVSVVYRRKLDRGRVKQRKVTNAEGETKWVTEPVNGPLGASQMYLAVVFGELVKERYVTHNGKDRLRVKKACEDYNEVIKGISGENALLISMEPLEPPQKQRRQKTLEDMLNELVMRNKGK